MALLEGIKVIDFSKWLPGQYCGMLLGDYGADVIKIEDLQGDATRRFWPEKTKGMSYWHLMLNRNKRGVALNLKKDGGRDLLLKRSRASSAIEIALKAFKPLPIALTCTSDTQALPISSRLFKPASPTTFKSCAGLCDSWPKPVIEQYTRRGLILCTLA